MAGNKRLEALQAEADALTQVEELKAVSREDVLTSDVKSQLSREGLSAAPTAVTNDANRFPVLYHAYDGRSLRLPMYQAEDRLKRRFPSTDEIPPEFHGKQVWHIRAPKTEPGSYEFQCRLNPNADPAIKAEMKAAGLQSSCRKKLKNGGFPTQFEADEHFRVKHPRRWASYQRYVTQNTQRTAADSMASAVQAMLALTTKGTEAQAAAPEKPAK